MCVRRCSTDCGSALAAPDSELSGCLWRTRLPHMRDFWVVMLGSRSAQSRISSFRTSSWPGCVLGFWWFPCCELHVYSSTRREAEGQSQYGVVTE
jgi:hypothetical protein